MGSSSSPHHVTCISKYIRYFVKCNTVDVQYQNNMLFCSGDWFCQYYHQLENMFFPSVVYTQCYATSEFSWIHECEMSVCFCPVFCRPRFPHSFRDGSEHMHKARSGFGFQADARSWPLGSSKVQEKSMRNNFLF